MNIVGTRIKIARENIGMSQEELADKMGYKSRDTISKIEIGKNNVTQSKIVKFSEILCVSPSYLMGWTNNMTNEEHDAGELADMIKKLDKSEYELIYKMVEKLLKKK